MATSPVEVVNKVFAAILQDALVCCLKENALHSAALTEIQFN